MDNREVKYKIKCEPKVFFKLLEKLDTSDKENSNKIKDPWNPPEPNWSFDMEKGFVIYKKKRTN